MKKILILLSLLFCGLTHADTIDINWRVGDSVYDTSTCTVGGDLNVPTPPTKYGYTFRGWKPKYTRIEYLESTGTQWIDTGLTTSVDTVVIEVISDVSFFNTFSSGSQMFYCSMPNAGLQVYVNSGRIYNQGQSISIQPSSRYLVETTTTDSERKVRINNGQFAIQSFSRSITDDVPIYTFGMPNNNGHNITARVYNQKFYKNGSLVRDFIPILDKDGVPCMYDTVSATCFYNAGTGNFIAGPVVGSE